MSESCDIAIDLRRLAHDFGGVQALRNLSLRVAAGGIHGLIGPNGSGKTTAFNVMSGVIRARAGQVLLRGRDVTRLSARERARLGIARTFQNLRLFTALSVRDNVAAGAHMRCGTGILGAIVPGPWSRRSEGRIAGLVRDAAEQLGVARWLDRCVSELSYGDRRRVEIARALATEPSVLLLDEPAAGMNPAETADLAQVLRSLNANGLTIILVDHDMRLVMGLCSRVTVLAEGSVLAEGPPSAIASDQRVIAAYLGGAECDAA